MFKPVRKQIKAVLYKTLRNLYPMYNQTIINDCNKLYKMETESLNKVRVMNRNIYEFSARNQSDFNFLPR